MQSKVSSWGNSLAVRIPKDYAQTLGIKADTPIELELEGDRLTLRAVSKRPTFDELLEGVTPELVGGELDWGEPQGNEVW